MRRTVREYRSRAAELATEMRGMLRRVVVGAAGSHIWQLLGYVGGDDEQETFDQVEMFQGIGFASRPGPGKGEVIIGHMGGRPGHPVGIASRDTGILPDLAADETAIFNSDTIVQVKEDGTIEAKSKAGVAVTLATKADIDALANWIATQINTHKHLGVTTGGGVSGISDLAIALPPAAAGTSVLKGE